MKDRVFFLCVCAFRFEKGIKCIKADRKKRESDSKFQGGRTVMLVFPFFFFYPPTSGPGLKMADRDE